MVLCEFSIEERESIKILSVSRFLFYTQLRIHGTSATLTWLTKLWMTRIIMKLKLRKKAPCWPRLEDRYWPKTIYYKEKEIARVFSHFCVSAIVCRCIRIYALLKVELINHDRLDDWKSVSTASRFNFLFLSPSIVYVYYLL